MRIIKLGFFSTIILFSLATIGGLLLPSHVLVSRATDVKSNPSAIIRYVNHLEYWKQWMEGMDATNVAIQDSANGKFANTSIQIITITDSTVIANWVSTKGNLQKSSIQLISDSTRKQTIVQWQFEEDLGWYPWERIGSIMNDKILGPMMEKNLQNLKKLVENQP